MRRCLEFGQENCLKKMEEFLEISVWLKSFQKRKNGGEVRSGTFWISKSSSTLKTSHKTLSKYNYRLAFGWSHHPYWYISSNGSDVWVVCPNTVSDWTQRFILVEVIYQKEETKWNQKVEALVFAPPLFFTHSLREGKQILCGNNLT